MTLSYADVSIRINKLVTERDGEWCGVPMPLPGLGLTLEDRHPYAAKIAESQAIIDGGRKPTTVIACSQDDMGWRVVNSWRGRMPGSDVPGKVVIMRHEDGRTRHGLVPNAPARNRMLFGPFETFDAWNLDTELTAIDTLATLLTERMFKAYILTGAFLERSKRSGLTYFFRRCRPTIVMTPHGSRRFKRIGREEDDDEDDDGMAVLACLCLHPIGYYSGTFGGAMTPTDDVIAHLLLMRGDEHMFWKRANHHHPLEPESGL